MLESIVAAMVVALEKELIANSPAITEAVLKQLGYLATMIMDYINKKEVNDAPKER